MNLCALDMKTPAPPGHGLWLSRFASLLGQHRAHVAYPNSRCMHCRSDNVTFYPVIVRPDFDAAILPNRLRRLFAERAFGVCVSCGVAQDFNRLSAQDVAEYCRILTNKDQAVSEEAFHTFPVPQNYIDGFNERYFSVRMERWKRYFESRSFTIDKVFFFRPFFGAAPAFIKDAYGAECSGMEISEVARKTTQALLPDFRFLSGNIHAVLNGVFLNSGPYDAIFDFHTLIHCMDVHDALGKMKDMLRPGGALILTHEINVKPSNPFHILFADEKALLKVLGAHFRRVDRIDACEIDPAAHIRQFTEKGDCPDFVGWNDV